MTRFLLAVSAILAAPSALAQTPPHDMSTMPGMTETGDTSEHHGANLMSGTFGNYPMARDASGTSWQPDAAGHAGVHLLMTDKWMVMGHAVFNGVYSSQGGPRGDDKAFAAGMAMVMARRGFDNGDSIDLHAMISPDPLMGKRGYPLLLASGETADGTTHLIDRQHPHDFFMELSVSYTKSLSNSDSVFIYGGLPGEPAFGPPAFMHRPAAQESPEAPITHHWLDSTHITYGVATLGWVHGNFKVEASRFRGREPDQHRYDIETGDLDSTAVRVSWNPNPDWALQASWADVISPEQLDPDVDQKRLSASALFTHTYADGTEVSATLAFGRKERTDGVNLDAWLSEASWKPDDKWTAFARGEAIESDELGLAHEINKVQKISFGLIRDWRLNEHTKFGIGALVARNFTDGALDPLYGNDPWGGMAFVRLKIS